MKNIWIFTEKEEKTIASIIAKGKKEQGKNEKFAIIDFDSFYKLFKSEEIVIIKKYLAINPKEIGYKLPYLGLEDIPADIVPIKNQKYLSNDKFFTIPTQYLPEEVFKAYEKINAAMKKDINKTLLVHYGYRSPARQVFIFFDILQRIYDYDFNKTIRRVCFPAYSEHVFSKRQAIDFTLSPTIKSEDFDKTEAYKWLRKNANKFGFHESYPKDNTLGMIYEPWHWHYALHI
jgi:hypothetical protein